MLKSFQALDA